MRRAAKKDANQTEIVDALRGIVGITVFCSNESPFDIVVGMNGKTFLYEVKANKKKKLTQAQIDFQKNWTGHWKRVETLGDVLIDLGLKSRYKNYPSQAEIDDMSSRSHYWR